MQTYSILILGSNGQVGQALRHMDWPSHVQIHAKSHQELDIKNQIALKEVLKSQRWHFVINASGYVQVDKAETDGMEPSLVNGLGILHLATLCRKYDIPLLHYTTDYVFDGTKHTPYTETDVPNPINTYGFSKLFGELSIRATWDKYIILRTSWVYSPYGRNFIKTILSMAKDKKDMAMVSDQHGIPTSAEDLAEVTRTILMKQLDHPDARKWGTYHYAGEGITTWYDYAQYILDAAYPSGDKPYVKSITTAEHRHLNQTVTNRPLYTALDTHHIQDMFGVKVRPWKEGVKTVVSKIV